MLNIFFEKGYKLNFITGSSFLRVTNNLDSRGYVLERVRNPGGSYVNDNYLACAHPQMIYYYTSWMYTETIVEENQVKRQPKEKKGVNALLTRKSIKYTLPLHSKPSIKEETVITIENCLYVQLESFSEATCGLFLKYMQRFMAITYLLAQLVNDYFGFWPHMIPVYVEGKKYKFLKKGKSLNHYLVNLLKYVLRHSSACILSEWSYYLKNLLEINADEDILGTKVKDLLDKIIDEPQVLRIKQGEDVKDQKISIKKCDMLSIETEYIEIYLLEYHISYCPQSNLTREVVFEHNLFENITIEGDRNNFLIQYLKQLASR